MAATDAPLPISRLPHATSDLSAFTLVGVDAAGNTARLTAAELVADIGGGPGVGGTFVENPPGSGLYELVEG